MKRTLTIIMIFSLGLFSGVFHGKADAEQPVETLYYEQVLETFEETAYTKENIVYQKVGEQDADLTIRTDFPAPVLNSTKYLGVKVNGKHGDVFKIVPPKPLVLEGYFRTIELWVYGRNFAGELSVLIQDGENQAHRLVFGRLNFLGWRKLKATTTNRVNQQDEFLNQERFVRILEFQYRPQNRERTPRWQYFYIDQVTASVRQKYTDRQSDDW